MSITIGILASYWIDYGTNYIGGPRCAPDIPYSGQAKASNTFDPYHDVPPSGCDGQSEASWRLPLAIQILPAIILGVGMIFFPDSPRWLLMNERDEDALEALSKLRRLVKDSPTLVNEYLEIKASIMLENTFAREHFPDKSGARLDIAQVSPMSLYMTISILLCRAYTTWNPQVHVLPDYMGPLQAVGYRMLRYVLPTVHGLQWYLHSPLIELPTTANPPSNHILRAHNLQTARPRREHCTSTLPKSYP